MLGLDGWAFLTEDDPVELGARYAVLRKARELAEVRDHNLAVAIANNVGKLFK